MNDAGANSFATPRLAAPTASSERAVQDPVLGHGQRLIGQRWFLLLLISLGQLACFLLAVATFTNWFQDNLTDVTRQQVVEYNQQTVTAFAALIHKMELRGLPRDLDALQELVERVRLPNQGFLSVVDRRTGKFLCHPQLTRDARVKRAAVVIQPLDSSARSSTGDMAELEPVVQSGRAHLSGRIDYVSAHLLPQLNAKLFAHQPEHVATQRVRRIVRFMWATALVLAIAFGIGCGLLNTAIMRCYENRLGNINSHLKQTIERGASTLLRTRDAIIFGLARLSDSRDNETGEHLERIRGYARLLVEQLAVTDPIIDENFQQTLIFASSLHDIGKVGIPDAILLKPGKLSPEERAVMQQHTIIGGECLCAIKQRLGDDDFLDMACQIAIAHHERWNGEGYPYRLVGEQIPLSARIVALADQYDALTSRRVYKLAMCHEEARKLIVAESGQHFEPRIVEAFLRREEEFRRIAEQHHPPALSLTGYREHDAETNSPELAAVRVDPELPAARAREAVHCARQLANELMTSVEQQASSIANLGSELAAARALRSPDGVEAIELRVQQLIRQVMEANGTLLDELTSTSYQLEQQANDMQDLLFTDAHDEVTGLMRRSVIEHELQQRSASGNPASLPISLLLIGIDDFDRFECEYDRERADHVLRAAARFLSTLTRDADLAASYDRGIFIVGLPRVRVAAAAQAAERIRAAFHGSRLPMKVVDVQLTVSIGLAQLESETTAEIVLKRAEQAMKEAQVAGGNMAFVHDQQTCLPVSEDEVLLEFS